MTARRLALGTAQFGLDYGIANHNGRVSVDEAGRILAEASCAGIETLDTAIAYGQSEETLGEIGVEKFQIISKLPALPERPDDIEAWVFNQARGSLRRLGVSKLYGILLHRPEELFGKYGSQLYRALQKLKDAGLVDKVGVSIYAPDELSDLTKSMRFDLIQTPLNILDRRIMETGWAERLASQGVELHARSAFLQGLLLLDEATRPSKFSQWGGVWREWHQWLAKEDLTPLQACIRYCLSVPEINKIIIGVDSLSQLRQIISAGAGELPPVPQWREPLSPNLLTPAQWRLL